MKEGLFTGMARRLGLVPDARPDVATDEEGLRGWLVQRLAKQIKVDPSQIITSKRFDEYGLDSRVAVRVSGELEKILERRLSPALLFEYPTIDDLARVLAKESTATGAPPAEPHNAPPVTPHASK